MGDVGWGTWIDDSVATVLKTQTLVGRKFETLNLQFRVIFFSSVYRFLRIHFLFFKFFLNCRVCI